MPAPKADPPRCDVYGCGAYAVSSTDGTEPGKPPANINTCTSHAAWPASDDGRKFTQTDVYKARK